MFLIKRSWRRLAELFRPKAPGGESDLISSSPLRLKALFAIVIVLVLVIAERVVLIGGQR